MHGANRLKEFRLDLGLPVWRFEAEGYVWEKRVLLPHGQNTVHVGYRLLQGPGQIRLRLRPSVHFRPHESPVNAQVSARYRVTAVERRLEVSLHDPVPPLRLYLHAEKPTFTLDTREVSDIQYRVEEHRGYDHLGALWSPGYFRTELTPGHEATLVASTESWETVLALKPEEALEAERQRRRRLIDLADPALRTGPARQFVLAADQFLIPPAGRVEDAARARAAGDEVRTVIAGYHWFTDWGRDTMISLEGLTLTTGRHQEAGYILRTFAHYVRDGLIPNLFPEGEKEGLYHTADATLWFFHALDRYVAATGDRVTLRLLLPKLQDIVDHHLRGTRFGIGVDPADGLLRQGEAGLSADVDGRQGGRLGGDAAARQGGRDQRPVVQRPAPAGGLAREEAGEAGRRGGHRPACRTRAALVQRALLVCRGRLSLRRGGRREGRRPGLPAQPDLRHLAAAPVLEPSRWEAVLDVVRGEAADAGRPALARAGQSRLQAEVLRRPARPRRRLSSGHRLGLADRPVRRRLAQASIPRTAPVPASFLRGFAEHLDEACIGSISEIFDAREPFTPRGCIAQAWSVAEVARCWARTAPSGPRQSNDHVQSLTLGSIARRPGPSRS